MLEPYRGIAANILTVPIAGHDCYSAEALADLARGLGFTAEPHDGVEQALAAVPAGARVLIFGSLYLAGQVLAANDQPPD
jgi:dihydrofolate synthase/folylpolyglutamate synthase